MLRTRLAAAISESDGYSVVVHTVCRHGFVHTQCIACVHVTSTLYDICAMACHAGLLNYPCCHGPSSKYRLSATCLTLFTAYLDKGAESRQLNQQQLQHCIGDIQQSSEQ